MTWDLFKQIYFEGDSGDGTGGGGGQGSGGGEGGEGAGGAGDQGGQGSAGAGGSDWRTGITDEHLRGSPAIKDIPNLDTLVKNHVELQSHLGNSIRIPSEDAGAEDKAAFYQKLVDQVPGVMMKPNLDDESVMNTLFTQLGRPEESGKYSMPEIDMKGVEIDTAPMEAFRDVAFKHGLSQRQFDGITRDVTQANIKHALDRRAALDEDIKGLSDEWGAAFDERYKAAQNIAERLNAPAEVLQAFQKNNAGASTIRMFYDLSTKLGGEGSGAAGDSSRGTVTMTPSEARARISEIMNNDEHPYWDTANPGHEAALKHMLELQQLANPE